MEVPRVIVIRDCSEMSKKGRKKKKRKVVYFGHEPLQRAK